MKKIFLQYIMPVVLLLALGSCKKGVYDVQETIYIGADKINRIELSPNSPVLVADGKSELSFKVKCYYPVNDSVNVAMIQDRIPFDKLIIESSEGKKISPNEPYVTSTDMRSLTFTCKYGNIASEPVKVDIYPAAQEKYEPIVVPIRVYVLYNEKNLAQAEGIDVEFMQTMFDRVNKVFSGELKHAPSTCDSKISFKVADVIKRQTAVENKDIPKFISDNLMKDVDKYFTIWIADGFGVWWSGGFTTTDCIPAYTLGDPANIPGLNKLKHIDSVEDIEELKPQNVGLGITYNDLFSMANPSGSTRLERTIGQYYGLLNTYHSDEDKELTNGDLDFCYDTFSYISRFFTLEKQTFPYKVEKMVDENGEEVEKRFYHYYDSFNIMDEISSATTVSRDQVKRIRQVIKDCPHRQQQVKK